MKFLRSLIVALCLGLVGVPAFAEQISVSSSNAGQQPIGILRTANLNSTADQAIIINAAKYLVRRITVTNVSTSLGAGLTAGGVYNAAAKGGTAIVANTQIYTALTGATVTLDLTLAVTTTSQTAGTLYLSLTTAFGSAATADVYVYGDLLN